MEQVVSFANKGPRLYGILHAPDGGVAAKGERIGVLILHAGRQPRRGPHRLYVKVARAVCDEGFYAFRYDNTGYGDSEGSEQETIAQYISDASCAIRLFRETQALDKLIIWGLCGGAIIGIHCAALNPARIDSLILCNLLFSLDHVGSRGLFRTRYRKLLTMTFWLRFLHGSPTYHLKRSAPNVIRLFRKALFPTTADQEFDRDVVKYMKVLPQAFARAAKPTFFIFGTGDRFVAGFREGVFGNPAWRQHLDAIPHELFELEGSDHNFSTTRYEAAVLERTLAWVRSRALGTALASPTGVAPDVVA